ALSHGLRVPARVAADGLTEALCLLCAISAVGCAAQGFRRQSRGFLLTAGVCTGLAYLVRPEGLLLVVAVGLVGGGLAVSGRWPVRFAVGRLTAFAVGALLPAAPYMALIGGLTTKPTPNEILHRIQGGPKNQIYQNDQSRLGGRPELFASWFGGTDSSKGAWAVRAVGSEVAK